MTLQATAVPTVRPSTRRRASAPMNGRLVDRLLGALGLLLLLSLVAVVVRVVALPAGDLLSAACPGGIEACLQAWREGLTTVAAISR